MRADYALSTVRTAILVGCGSLQFVAGIAVADPAQQLTSVEYSVPAQKVGGDVPTLRPWTAADSVSITYYDPEKIFVAPNGVRFFIRRYHGELGTDSNVDELLVFGTDDVNRALAQVAAGRKAHPQPLQHLVRRISGPHHVWTRGMSWAKWDDEGEAISFAAADDAFRRQLYQLKVITGSVAALTAWPRQVESIDHFGLTLVASSYKPEERIVESGYPVRALTRREVTEALMPQPDDSKGRLTIFVSYRGGTPWELEGSNGGTAVFTKDGRKGVQVRLIDGSSATWHEYDHYYSEAGYNQQSGRFVLIDAEHRQMRPLLDAPTGLATTIGNESKVLPGALWADDRHVLLINTALPLVHGKYPERNTMAYIVDYDIESGQWTVLEPLVSSDPVLGFRRRVSEVGWLNPGKELLIRHEVSGRPTTGTAYVRQGNGWLRHDIAATTIIPNPVSSAEPVLIDGLTIELRQGMNMPPVVMASNGRYEVALTHPDPALDGVWMARQLPFQWRAPTGELITGGLLLPRIQRGPVPLVIEAYGYDPGHFMPDGPELHAYCAQPLTAKGFAVLVVDILGIGKTRAKANTPNELTEFVGRIEAAADSLGKHGLIDRRRVGLIGFSRAGYASYYALTHPGEIPLGAVVVDDGFTGQYPNYLLDNAVSPPDFFRAAYELPKGGSFWKDAELWLKIDGSFNVDRIETPALFAIHRQMQISLVASTVGAFVLNRRPLEYLILPFGEHVLSLPRQRFASMQASIDWMSFWLSNYERSEPVLEGGETEEFLGIRYKRWRQMRADWKLQKEWEATGNFAGSKPLPELIRGVPRIGLSTNDK